MKSQPIDSLFRAFADRTRLRILLSLREGELCVGDLVAILRLPQAKTSRHLAYLLRAGLVRVRRAGRWSHYALAAPGSALHQALLDCLAHSAAGLSEVTRDAARAAAVRGSGGCCPDPPGPPRLRSSR